MQSYPASLAIFTNGGASYEACDLWVQPELGATLQLISDQGNDGFYKGKTADLLVAEMNRNDGLITHEDLEQYRPCGVSRFMALIEVSTSGLCLQLPQVVSC